jgi:hypothetical protein
MKKPRPSVILHFPPVILHFPPVILHFPPVILHFPPVILSAAKDLARRTMRVSRPQMLRCALHASRSSCLKLDTTLQKRSVSFITKHQKHEIGSNNIFGSVTIIKEEWYIIERCCKLMS